MASLTFVWPLLVLVYTVLQVFAQERQMEFVAVDGEQSESLFIKLSPSLLACCGICAANADCASFFYWDAYGICVGYRRIYATDVGLNSLNGTKYLYGLKLVPTPTTSTSTTSSPTSTTTSTATMSTASLTTTSTATTTECPESEWKCFNGHLYKLEQELEDYDGAVTICRSQQAELVHIESDAENEFIGEMVAKEENGDYKIYIGASDRDTEGDWRWEDDNSQFTYHKWRGGSAFTNEDRDCLGMTKDDIGDHEWKDLICSVGRKFVCKKSISYRLD